MKMLDPRSGHGVACVLLLTYLGGMFVQSPMTTLMFLLYLIFPVVMLPVYIYTPADGVYMFILMLFSCRMLYYANSFPGNAFRKRSHAFVFNTAMVATFCLLSYNVSSVRFFSGVMLAHAHLNGTIERLRFSRAVGNANLYVVRALLLMVVLHEISLDGKVDESHIVGVLTYWAALAFVLFRILCQFHALDALDAAYVREWAPALDVLILTVSCFFSPRDGLKVHSGEWLTMQAVGVHMCTELRLTGNNTCAIEWKVAPFLWVLSFHDFLNAYLTFQEWLFTKNGLVDPEKFLGRKLRNHRLEWVAEPVRCSFVFVILWRYWRMQRDVQDAMDRAHPPDGGTALKVTESTDPLHGVFLISIASTILGMHGWTVSPGLMCVMVPNSCLRTKQNLQECSGTHDSPGTNGTANGGANSETHTGKNVTVGAEQAADLGAALVSAMSNITALLWMSQTPGSE